MDTKTHEVTRRRFTVHDYHRMGESGIPHEDDRVELIEGEIFEMAAIRTRHVGDYRKSLPMPEDVLLLIEVSDATLSYERNVKLPLYARAGIPEVWILDLPGEIFERHTGLSGSGYRRAERARRGEALAPLTFPGLTLRADAVPG